MSIAKIPPLDGVLSLMPTVSNPSVKLLQQRLIELGYHGESGKPLAADGKFGPNTLLAVNRFKLRNKLGNEGSAAGKIGPQSWAALFSDGAIPEEGYTPSPPAKPASLKLIYYSQEDARWRHMLYSNYGNAKQTIGTSGCGPTCFAMAVSTLVGKPLLPPDAARYAMEHGFRTRENGTSWDYFGHAASAFGLSCRQTASLDEVKQAISAVNTPTMVIASMRPGHFTQSGHYIVLHGMVGEASGVRFRIFDPNQDNKRYGTDDWVEEGVPDDGRVEAKEQLFRKEAGQYWILRPKS
ncbi:C39 family peptidase [Paenibacillus aurantiacus]|uniref:C39 family peptidase n=1 Tax=Paenibacillus aurantiacus TaxID=1936118 RepID=A0ABV5KVJ9_9BACL